MQIPHDAFVLVADGRKSLFFRNEGDGEYPNLVVEHAEEHSDPKDREIKTDAPGRAFSGGGVSDARSAYSETDFHQQEEDRFAAETAEMLRTRALANDFASLVVVAPPRALGELRKHYDKEVERRLIAEVPKDLVNLPVVEIEKILQAQ